MKKIKKHLTGILLCLFELAVGVLVLIDPMGFTTGIIIAAGIGLLIFGLANVIKYYRTEAKAAAAGQFLLKGLLALTAGCFCVFQSEWFLATFPAFTILLGVAVFAAGLVKIQLSVDMLRAKNKRWFLGLIGAVVSIGCAIVILKVPFAATKTLWMFTGVSLIVEAVVDAVMLIVSNTKKKEKPQQAKAPQEKST